MKSINGFSLYYATSDGKIFSRNYKRTAREQVIVPSQNKDGYLTSMFKHDDGSYKTRKIHVIVALAFLGERPEGLSINHKNGIKTDNRPENLEYVTHSENIKHAYSTGLRKGKSGSDNVNSKLNEQQVKEIREHAKNCKGRYYGRKQLAEKYGISECYVKEIVNRRKNIWKTA